MYVKIIYVQVNKLIQKFQEQRKKLKDKKK